MPLVSFVLNVLWVVTGGIWMALGWLLAAVLMAVSIIGIPWARSAVTIARYTLLPFGQTAVRRDEFRGREDIGTGGVGFIGNVIWFVLAGWWLALGHLVAAAGLAITIIGLPFAWAHLKLALLALWPVGTEIVTDDEVERRRVYGRV
ncbi:YccF domain-containing protein [Azospirillum agricola]|uniref:YccF domain-containing protein n=1 Tax=Azospirillum agricola TaxID=1720247 RepID=UPI000A0F07E2|nr:YccF domain-containing protein [Azospirillum agricola]SMH60752.1 Uncharacterized membrane protein YccF, DUF307 family [Azospirillum lipoferum]